MSTVEVIALVVTLAAVFVGLTGAIVLVGQRPSFWVGAAIAVISRAWPLIKSYITKRNSPEVERRMAECVRRGGEWDNNNKTCRY